MSRKTNAARRSRRTGGLAGGLAGLVALAVLAAGCGGSSPHDHRSGTPGASARASGSPTPSSSASHDMASHDMGSHDMGGSHDMEMPEGDGRAAEVGGYRLEAVGGGGLEGVAAGSGLEGPGQAYRFRILDRAGKPVTRFELDQTKLMHVYLIRSDLSGFQHVHPTMANDGTWTARFGKVEPGAYRVYASFVARTPDGAGAARVLGRAVSVPGAVEPRALPGPGTVARVDGYELRLSTDRLMSGMAHELAVTVTRNGRAVRDLQPYLGTYAHLTAFRAGNQAIAHLHPTGRVRGGGGPTLRFEAMVPSAGTWRVFLQFRTAGRLHTAAVTVTAS